MSVMVWLDPGLLTGVCMTDPVTGELKYLDEHDLFGTMQRLEWGMQLHDGPQPLIDVTTKVQVGWETYTIMQGPQGQAPWSLEVIGAAKYLCQRNGYTVLPPAPPSARLVCTDAMLKALGWYPKVRGKKDAKSAAMHTVAWWLRTDSVPETLKEAIYGQLK